MKSSETGQYLTTLICPFAYFVTAIAKFLEGDWAPAYVSNQTLTSCNNS